VTLEYICGGPIPLTQHELDLIAKIPKSFISTKEDEEDLFMEIALKVAKRAKCIIAPAYETVQFQHWKNCGIE
jgi:hypothetical protein